MNQRNPELSTVQRVQAHAGYQSLQPVQRPPYWGVDLDPARRPGVPMMWEEPRAWPNTRYPPRRQAGRPAAVKHGRPNRPLPPVFSTALPPTGLAGAIREFAGRYPDHYPRYWMLKLLADRVESWGHRARRAAPLALPFMTAAFVSAKLGTGYFLRQTYTQSGMRKK